MKIRRMKNIFDTNSFIQNIPKNVTRFVDAAHVETIQMVEVCPTVPMIL